MIKQLVYIGLLSISAASLHAKVAVGDGVTPGQTFQFSVGQSIYNSSNATLWTAAGSNIPGGYSFPQYGLAFTQFINVDGSSPAVLTAYPYLTDHAVVVTFDPAAVPPVDIPAPVANPLFRQYFAGITMLGSNLVLTLQSDLSSIYYIGSVSFDDGQQGTTSDAGMSVINQFQFPAASHAFGNQIATMGGLGTSLLVASATYGQNFGGGNGYLSLLGLGTQSQNGGQYPYLFDTFDYQITTATPQFIAETNSLQSIGEQVSMFPSMTAGSMYLGFDVLANATVGSVGVGLITASVDTSLPAITLGLVVPNGLTNLAVVNTPISVVAGQSVAVKNITTTVTSTGLSYIIVASDDGAGGSQSIYALPMVSLAANASDNGKVGDFDIVESTFLITGSVYRQQGFTQVIPDAAQIDINSAGAVVNRLLVGGRAVPTAAGTYVSQLFAQGDVVYIAINQPFGAGTTPGLFASQALFDNIGRIMAWTPWQRVAGNDSPINFAMKNGTTDATIFVGSLAAPAVQNTQVVQTTWNNTTDLVNFVQATGGAMPQNFGGAQGIIPTSQWTPNFNGQYTLAIATGNNAVTIAQTGSADINGNIIINAPQDTLTLNASNGLAIGSVVTACFANAIAGNPINLLFFGGDGGLSVYSIDAYGYTFGYNFDGVATSLATAGKSCKTVGNFSFVKKIIGDGQYVYVMTRDAVYAVNLADATNKFVLNNPAPLNPVLVVSAASIDPNAYCLDMLVDNGLVLLGTTAGLYSITSNGGAGVPVAIPVPMGLSAASRLWTVSSQANFNKAFYNQSNLYVLGMDFTYQQSQINRFTITNGVIVPIQDQLLQGQNGPLVIFDIMVNNLFIDGSLGFVTSYRVGVVPAIVKYMSYTLHAGGSSTHALLKTSTADLSIASVLNSLGITGIVRDYGTGSLMMAADFGVLADS